MNKTLTNQKTMINFTQKIKEKFLLNFKYNEVKVIK